MTQLADDVRTSHQTIFRTLEAEGDAVPASVDALRKAGMERFNLVGFPTRKQEEWRLTDVRPIAETRYAPGEIDSGDVSAVDGYRFGDEAAAELVFINGHYSAQLSKLGKHGRVRIGSLRQAFDLDPELVARHLGRIVDLTKHPFAALNSGMLRDGAFVYLPKGSTVEGPIHLLFVSTNTGEQPTVSHPRVLLIADDNSEASVVETYAGPDGQRYFTNAVSEFAVGNDCRIDHNKLNQESLDAHHVHASHISLGRNSTFVSHNTTLGGRLTRNDVGCVMGGEGAYPILNGLVVIGGSQHCDNHTLLDHAVPNCPSHELYKHVLGGKSTGVFKGQILVRLDAQKTDSKQTSKSLLLSDDAVMNSQPALEIYADDVKCTHGSTIGPVDEEMMYYAQTRGIGREAARHLLTYAFAADVTRRIKVAAVRHRIEEVLAAQHGLPLDLRITDLGEFDEAAR
ncbi:MAG TPA: Fe-S cluster assembly protein SufD [Tepidisphaeraceae bacterium]|nr:Fe-S cluster assembly protein SufD [Tepidisphaeraceae bacterium]